MLNDGLGPNVLARLDRDVLAQSGVKWLIIFEGVNDIGTADPRQILPAFDSGDHLHLNPAGYQALASAVRAGLFRQAPLPGDFGFR